MVVLVGAIASNCNDSGGGSSSITVISSSNYSSMKPQQHIAIASYRYVATQYKRLHVAAEL